MKNRSLYDVFYCNKKIQKKVISDDNFTYQTLISLYDKYLKNRKRILDVGCGVGTIDFYLCKKGHELSGVDISKNAINIALKNSKLLGMDKKITFIRSDLSSITNIGLYDAVIALEVLEHIRKVDKVIKNLYKLCLNDAVVIASSPSKNAPLYRIGLLKKFDRNVGHLRRYSEMEYKRLFENNGFEVVDLIKTEGVLRNFLYTNKCAQSLIRLIKGPLIPLVSIIDNMLVKLFGESNYYIVAFKK
jgi:SAM-dependent methyltransferase